MAEEITVAISPSGDVKVSVKGIKGKACKALTKHLEESFGDAQKSDTTPEYYEPERKVSTTVKQR
jgi:hypothetical protein